MARVLIIGYGNPLRGDDGLGPAASERLAQADFFALHQVREIQAHQLTPELAADCAAVDAVLFVDAAAAGPPGQVRCEPVAPGGAVPQSMSHHLTPATLLACAAVLYDAHPRAWLLSIVGENFDVGQAGLSATVQAALPELIARARQLVESL